MSDANNAVIDIVKKWSNLVSSSTTKYWEDVRRHVSCLKQYHSDKIPLNQATRIKVCSQCLRSIQTAVTNLERIQTSTSRRRGPVVLMIEVLEEVMVLLASMLKPCDSGLASQLCDISVVKRVIFLSTVECDDLKKAAVEVLRNFVDDRSEVVDAVIRLSNEQLGCDLLLPSNVPKKDDVLEFISTAVVGARIPPGLCQRAQLVLPGPENSLSAPAQLHQVLTADILPVLVSLLNAPWRGTSRSWLLLGACPETKKLRGISMNFDDQDAFRQGFDQHVLDRLHPQPTADIVRLHMLPLNSGETSSELEPSQVPFGVRRQMCEQKQRERTPCVIAVEVGLILIEDGFSYSDRDKFTKLKRFVTITMQDSGVKLMTKSENTRLSKPNLPVKQRLTKQIAQLDRQLADVKKQKSPNDKRR